MCEEETAVPMGEYDVWVEGKAVGKLVGGYRLWLPTVGASLSLGHLKRGRGGTWGMELGVVTEPDTTAVWIIRLGVAHVQEETGKTSLLRLATLPLQDGLGAQLYFPPPPDWTAPLTATQPGHIRLRLNLRFVHHRLTRLPIFFPPRHPTDIQVEVHQRMYFINPTLLRLALHSDSPLLSTLKPCQPKPPDWSVYFSTLALFQEFLHHVYPTTRSLCLTTVVELGRTAVHTNFPALIHKCGSFLRKAPGISLLQRIRMADGARLHDTMAILISGLADVEMAEVQKLVSAGLCMGLNGRSRLSLLSVLSQPSIGTKLARKPVPVQANMDLPDMSLLIIRSGDGGVFHSCRELLEEHSPVIQRELAGQGPRAEMVLYGTTGAMLAALLAWLGPGNVVPEEEELKAVVSLMRVLDMGTALVELENSLSRRLGTSPIAIARALELGSAYDMDWLCECAAREMGSGMMGRKMLEDVKKALGTDGWAGLRGATKRGVWAATLGVHGREPAVGARPSAVPLDPNAFLSAHTLYGLHNHIVFP